MLERRRMWRLSRRTLWQAIPTVVGILLLNFLLLRLIPGDAVDVLAGESGGASAETLLQWRSHFGLDLSLMEQLQRYLGQLAHLDLGMSPRFNLPARTDRGPAAEGLAIQLQRREPPAAHSVETILDRVQALHGQNDSGQRQQARLAMLDAEIGRASCRERV